MPPPPVRPWTPNTTDNASKVSQQKIDSYAESAGVCPGSSTRPPLRQVDSLRAYNEQVGKMVDSQSHRTRPPCKKQIAQIDQTSTEVVPLMLKMIDSLEQFVSPGPAVPEGGA